MTTPRRQARDAFMARLLEAATQQLAEHGAAGLGMRTLAKQLKVTPGALYRYVASRDELLTFLVVNAYTSLGDAVATAEAEVAADDLEGQWLAIWRASRIWALAHRHEWGLIYGTPVPGYRAPQDTVAPASGITLPLARVATQVWTNAATTGKTEPIAPGLDEDLQRVRAWLEQHDLPASAPDHMIMTVLRAWTELIGAISLELFGHYVGSIEHGAEYLDHLARASFEAL